ncbi:MAG: ribonuclease P protein component [Candidatus Cloacimonadia bacterium]
MRFITKTVEYNEVYRSHRRYQGKYFNLLVHFSSAEECIGIGIIVSSKVGKAVIRNKLKRRIKGFLHGYKGSLPKGVKVVIIAKREAATIDWTELCKDLEDSFKSISLSRVEHRIEC